ncbi:Gibberellin 2-oxidase 8 [Tripterygium wilfordii]|uniref:gibberellin 2beta-dioxygenase n=1 Tax=Tripterygium wilfordii TaxID=458696 RepID=A0A7J7DMD5_TRIWF|nr:gibberellin 2-beta-dioxygenase 6-like [Tripterygium wilfordii]KAF5747491.1 Gibberellin 2-oxidase 8 [Tripterygium wilfordii]
MVESNPPLLNNYLQLSKKISAPDCEDEECKLVTRECQLPLIYLKALNSPDKSERQACSEAICKTSSEWGFFQLVDHGISTKLLRKMRREQVRLFETPFEKKATCGILNNSYRWGSPTATRLKQFSWSEAFHVPLDKVSEPACYEEFTSLREVMIEFSAEMSKLARLLAGVLAENLGSKIEEFDNICHESTCFLRLNHYPACPISPNISGFVPHTDSDFLTILYQDQVGGLQLMKDCNWVAVKPNQDALIVNIGDLFQAWSNDIYKSVEHRVVTNEKMERYSVAYFLCPSYDSLIGSSKEPSIYRNFTFGEYRKQVREDVNKTGHKVGLPRFRILTPENHSQELC